MLTVEIVYVTADQSTVHLTLELPSETTIADALTSSGIYDSYPETIHMPVGIYARQVSKDTVLKAGDRVELYRALALDPKEKRRQKARVKK